MMRYVLRGVCICMCLVAWSPLASMASRKPYSDRSDVRSFVDTLVQKHQFNRAELLGLFHRAEQQRSVLEAIAKPAERELTWSQYRPIFVTAESARNGSLFWAQHAEVLARAEQTYGVPPQIIVAIVGVETRYGKQVGRYPVFDALTTLGFDSKHRRGFFRAELEHFLLLARDETFDPSLLVGSYAGAMGWPQFISSSYRQYAVDFDQDGRRDLWESPADVVGSVANYFKRHGWRSGQPVALPAQVTGDVSTLAVGRGRRGLKPEKNYAAFSAAGVSVQAPPDAEQLATLIELDVDTGKEYWLGLNNFYVITRYNQSAMYALAVFQLSEAIAVQYAADTAAQKKGGKKRKQQSTAKKTE
jgi:membrane-bound lytic murein transglycosylase B